MVCCVCVCLDVDVDVDLDANVDVDVDVDLCLSRLRIGSVALPAINAIFALVCGVRYAPWLVVR